MLNRASEVDWQKKAHLRVELRVEVLAHALDLGLGRFALVLSKTWRLRRRQLAAILSAKLVDIGAKDEGGL